MLRSRKSLLPILVVLALLLSFANPRKALGQSKKPGLIKQNGQQNESPIKFANPTYTPNSASSANDQKSSGDSPWMIVLTGAMALATVFLAIFNYQLVGVTHEMTKATAEAAKAAALALNAEKPYVFVKSPQMIVRAEPAPYPDAIPSPNSTRLRFEISYELKNHGKGVAIIDGVRARFHLARTRSDKPTSEEQARGKTTILEIRDRVIGPADVSLNFIDSLDITPETWRKILPHQLELTLLGFVQFRDVFERRYRQDFCFRYLVGSFSPEGVVDTDWFLAGPAKNNKYHQYESAGLTDPE